MMAAFLVGFLLAIFSFEYGGNAYAGVLRLQPSMAEELLSESDPTAWAPNRFGIEDFQLEWVGKPLDGVEIGLGSKSFQWVRVQDVLVLPRARLTLSVNGYDSGKVSNTGFSEDIVVKDGEGKAEMPIPLISGEKNPIRLELMRGNKKISGEIRVRFKPREIFAANESRVFLDQSCSPYKVSIDSKGLWKDDWAFIGCRMVRVQGKKHRTSSLEVFVYWDNVGQSIEVGGVDTPSTSVSVWPLRLRPEPGEISLKGGGHEFSIHYFIPEYLHNGFFGLGLGPYYASFRENQGPLEHTLMPTATLYGSYFLTEQIRIVGFGLISMEPRTRTDIGLYLNFEQFRFLDRRIGVKLLIGGHGIGFRANDRFYGVASFPQGVEIIFTDAFVPGNNLTLGAFAYPLIANNSYYNIWLRWGNQIFYEINYIAWETLVDSTVYGSASFGVSIGFPIFRFW